MQKWFKLAVRQFQVKVGFIQLGSSEKANSSRPAWRPKTSEIPRSPGVYRFRDDQGRVIYVGKAKNLRARLTNYFQDPAVLHPRTAQMVSQARSVQWTVVASEVEALTLEFQWIKQFDPRFNVMYRDDKSYPYLSVSMDEEFPRVAISRDAKKPGSRYFGPYTKVWAIRETIDLLLPVFPMRSCTAGVFRRAKAQDRPCLLGYIDRCSAPCVDRVTPEEHRRIAEDLCRFMDGDTDWLTTRLTEEMGKASSELDFELAARRRDELSAVTKVSERNTIVLDASVDADFFALVADDLDASVHAFFVRGGRVRGTRGWVLERIDDRDPSMLMHDLIEQVYAARAELSTAQPRSAPRSIDDVVHLPVQAIPRQILVSVEPAERAVLQKLVSTLAGRNVEITVPQRGKKVALMQTVSANATEALNLQKTRKAGDLTQRAVALQGLVEALELDRAPLRIECFDISHTAGQHRVGSMVVFEDGIPRKDAYRTFNILGEGEVTQDDTAAMTEVLQRRFRRFGMRSQSSTSDERWQTVGADSSIDERSNPGAEDYLEEDLEESGPVDPNSGKPRRFAYDPDLVVVDGGVAQVNAAYQALLDVGVRLPVVGIAKRLEELWVPGNPYPVILPRTAPALYLLQHLRDESHRFAIRAHRRKRSGAQTRSALDKVPGLGPARQAALLKHFGSLKKIREATVDEIAAVQGFGEKRAAALKVALDDRDAEQKQAD